MVIDRGVAYINSLRRKQRFVECASNVKRALFQFARGIESCGSSADVQCAELEQEKHPHQSFFIPVIRYVVNIQILNIVNVLF